MHRPVGGASVRVLDGPLTGTVADTDLAGFFELRSSLPGAVRLQVSRDGFKTTTYTAQWQGLFQGGGARIRLESIEPTEVPLDPGEYTLTISFDPATARDMGSLPACTGFPADASTRSFTATITASPNAEFDRVVSIEGPTVFANSQVWLAIGGRSVAFHEMENPFTEEMPGFRYLNASFRHVDEPVGVSETAISIPAQGFFHYCELSSPTRLGWEQCQHIPAEQTLKSHACLVDRAQLVFTRR